MLKQELEQKLETPTMFVKRDGFKYPFELFKLEMVIHALGLDDVKTIILSKIMDKLDDDTVTAQDVAAAFRQSLNELGYIEAAKKYVAYRKHDVAEWEKQIDTKSRLERLVHKDPTIVNENANKDSDVFSTQRDLTAGTVGKTVGLTMMPEHIAKAHLRGDIHWHDLDYTPLSPIFSTQRDLTAGTVGKTVGLTMMPEHIAKAHLRGDIHWHDLDYTPLSPMSNCCLIDFKEMLTNGFKIGNAYMENPNSIGVVTSQVAQIITNVASSQYGGCSFDRADEVLAPFAQKNYEKHLKDAKELMDDEEKADAFAKKRTKKDIYDAIQSLEYEINTMFSSQGSKKCLPTASRLVMPTWKVLTQSVLLPVKLPKSLLTLLQANTVVVHSTVPMKF